MFSRIVDCSMKNMAKTPVGLPSNTTYLDLNINSLENWHVNLPNLKGLSVDYNEFAEIPDDLPESLEYLTMGRNEVKEIKLSPGRIKLFFFLPILFFVSSRFNSILCHFTFLPVGSKHLRLSPSLSLSLSRLKKSSWIKNLREQDRNLARRFAFDLAQFDVFGY